MADTRFAICSRALVRVGGAPITSFEDGTAEAIAAGREYEAQVRAQLASYRWRFATAQTTLNRLEDTPAGGRWQHAFQLPADVLVMHAVTVGGHPVPYDRYGDLLFSNHAEGLVADYTFRQAESVWPAYFTNAMVMELASVFARVLARDTALSDLEAGKAMRAWQQARTADSQAQTTRRLHAGRLLGVR